MTSMEEFDRIVNVDYFTQRRVEKVTEREDGALWTIHFEGGGQLRNYDSNVPTPRAVVGAALTRTILDGTNRVTRLQFGLEEVMLNPMEYAIIDPNYTKGQLVYPQRSRYNMPTPPHPDERVADGPSQEWLDEQARERGENAGS